MPVPARRRQVLQEQGVRKALETRGSLGLGSGPIADMFAVVEQHGILLLRGPAPHSSLNACFAGIQGYHCIFINSDHTLGRQIFSAAHEFYHYLCRGEVKGCEPGTQCHEEQELGADAFASEFLIPQEGLKAAYRRSFDYAEPHEREVIILQQYYQVSYAAMAVALHKAGLSRNQVQCPVNLAYLTRQLGYSTELIEKTQPAFPRAFMSALSSNYEERQISYGKLKSLLGIFNYKPSDFGFAQHEE